MTGGRGVHTVGVTASSLGLLALLLLPFAEVARSRIVTGDPVRLFDAADPAGAIGVLAPFVVLLVLSLRNDRRSAASLARGLASGVAIAWMVWQSGLVASTLSEATGPFARVSVGSGVWIALLAASMGIMSSRAELRNHPWYAAAVGVVPLVKLALLVGMGSLDDMGLMKEFANNRGRFWNELGTHLSLAMGALGIAVLIGTFLGILAYRRPGTRNAVFGGVNALQTIPSLAMLGMLVAPLAAISQRYPVLREFGIRGIGWFPVIIVLTMYALLPVVRNVYAGLRNVPEAIIDAGRGMGMTDRQITTRLRLPLALPVVFSGLRTADVQTVGNATVGAFAAAGTLGIFIFTGLSQQALDLVLLGSITLVALSLGTEAVLVTAQHALAARYGDIGEDAFPEGGRGGLP